MLGTWGFRPQRLLSVGLGEMRTDSSYKLISSNANMPIDYMCIVYFIMFYEGVGNLFPWNAFITASKYYENRFCGTDFHSNFENYFSISFTISQTLGLALSVIYQNKISLKNKIIWPLAVYSMVFFLTTVLVTQNINAELLFWITLFSCVMCGMCGAWLSSGLYGLGAMLPPMYTAALMNGSGLAGLVVSFSSILTLLAADSSGFCSPDETTDCTLSTDYSALAYFIIATLILLSCVALFLFLLRQPFTKYYIDIANKGIRRLSAEMLNPFIIDEDERESDFIGGMVSGRARVSHKLSPSFSENQNKSNSHRLSSSNGMSNGTSNHSNGTGNSSGSRGNRHSASRNNDSNGIYPVEATVSASVDGAVFDNSYTNAIIEIMNANDQMKHVRHDSEEDYEQQRNLTLRELYEVYTLVWIPSISVILTFVVTIAVFPSLIVLIESTNKCKSSDDRFSNDLFVPCLFLLFNLFDFIGRVSGGSLPVPFNAKNIWIPSVARFIFFPLFLMCNIPGSQFTVLLDNDAYPIIFIILFGFTNGYVATCSMMFGAASIINSKDSALIGTIMIFSLTLGLGGGACLSFLLAYISQGH